MKFVSAFFKSVNEGEILEISTLEKLRTDMCEKGEQEAPVD